MAEPVSSLPPTPEKGAPIPWPRKQSAEHPNASVDQPYRGRDAAQAWWNKMQSAASKALARAESKWAGLKRDHPLQLIAAAAVAGFLLGAVVRVRRSHHE